MIRPSIAKQAAAALGASGQISITLAEDSELGRAGEVITLAVSPSDVSIPEVVDTYLGGYTAPGNRADEGCPIVLNQKDVGKLRNYGLNNVYRRVQVETSKQAAIPEVDAESELIDFQCVERALGSFIPQVTQDQSTEPLVDPRLAGARRIEQALALDRECRVWELLTTSGNWNADNVTTVGAGNKWNDAVNGNPIKDIQDLIEASAQIVTDVWFPLKVAHAFLRNQNVRDHMRMLLGDNAPNASILGVVEARLQPVDFVIPGLPPFHVVPGKVLNETTSKLDPIMGNHAVLTCTPNRQPTDATEIFTAMTVRRRGSSGTGYISREVQLQTRGLEGGRLLIAGHAEDLVMTANNAGGLILNAWQA